MNAVQPPVAAPQAHAGLTSIADRALQHLALAVVRDAASVGRRDISVDLRDDLGALRVRVRVPALYGTGQTISAQAETIRDAVIARLGALADRRVGAVDIDFVGTAKKIERRVR